MVAMFCCVVVFVNLREQKILDGIQYPCTVSVSELLWLVTRLEIPSPSGPAATCDNHTFVIPEMTSGLFSIPRLRKILQIRSLLLQTICVAFPIRPLAELGWAKKETSKQTTFNLYVNQQTVITVTRASFLSSSQERSNLRLGHAMLMHQLTYLELGS